MLVRKQAKTSNLEITVGTLGEMKLEGKTIFLDPDNRKLPVANYLYKIVDNKTTNEKSVYVVSNNPHTDKATIETELKKTFGENVKNLGGNFEEVSKGFTVEIPYDDFVKVVKIDFDGENIIKHPIPLSDDGKSINVIQNANQLNVVQVKYEMARTMAKREVIFPVIFESLNHVLFHRNRTTFPLPKGKTKGLQRRSC
jgi:hypothetical protein